MNNELNILIQLLEDPDPEVYEKLSLRILSEGRDIIPQLEEACLTATTGNHFERIMELISELEFRELKNRFSEWLKTPEHDLLQAILILNKLVDPHASEENLVQSFARIKNDIWLELSNRLTALEKTKVVNHFFFSRNGFKIESQPEDDPRHFSLSRFFSARKGIDPIVFVAYTIVVRQLGLPVYAVDIPGIYLLAWLDLPFTPRVIPDPGNSPALFFIYPGGNGRIFGMEEVRHFTSTVYPEYSHSKILPYSDLSLVKQLLQNLILFAGNSGKLKLKEKFIQLLNLCNSV